VITMPVSQHVNEDREHAGEGLGEAVEQARTLLLAVVGAGDVAVQTVVDTVNEVGKQLNQSVSSARASLNDLPSELSELRHTLAPAELGKLADSYAHSTAEAYDHLAHRGEDAWGQLRSQPPVQRVEDAIGDARDLVAGRVSRTIRSAGEKTARATEQTATDIAEIVQKTAADTAQTVTASGAKAASNTRSTARKTAHKTQAAQRKEPKSAAHKTTGKARTTSQQPKQ
jgi:heparin binding hemagglutinin HbhA